MAGFAGSLIYVAFLCGLELPAHWREKLRIPIWDSVTERKTKIRDHNTIFNYTETE